MTSASELFYQRRSRVSRANTDLGLEPSLSDRNFNQNNNRRHRHNHNNRHDLDGCDPLRRYPHVRTPFPRLSSPSVFSIRLLFCFSCLPTGTCLSSTGSRYWPVCTKQQSHH
uniref:Uncharacterized protein n=1 Tax=Salix viminalis TaxID=40686 RepID=A0A6N2LYV0_SALVM